MLGWNKLCNPDDWWWWWWWLIIMLVIMNHHGHGYQTFILYILQRFETCDLHWSCRRRKYYNGRETWDEYSNCQGLQNLDLIIGIIKFFMIWLRFFYLWWKSKTTLFLLIWWKSKPPIILFLGLSFPLHGCGAGRVAEGLVFNTFSSSYFFWEDPLRFLTEKVNRIERKDSFI